MVKFCHGVYQSSRTDHGVFVNDLSKKFIWATLLRGPEGFQSKMLIAATSPGRITCSTRRLLQCLTVITIIHID